MKTKVLEFLKNPPVAAAERYNQAMALAVESQLSPQLLARYNRRGATVNNAEALEYELQRYHNISAVDVSQYEPQPETTVNEPEPETGSTPQLSDVQLDPFRHVLKDMNDNQKAGLRFREQYPFLREKDTPNELKVLAADAITSFEDYKAKHQDLFDALVDVAEPKLTEAQVFETANSLLEDFETNRAVHAELEHYAKEKQILGEHEIFGDLKLEREVAAIEPEKLGQSRSNAASQVTKKKKKLEAAKTAEEKAEAKAELAFWEKKRSLIDERIKPGKEK